MPDDRIFLDTEGTPKAPDDSEPDVVINRSSQGEPTASVGVIETGSTI
jgi:hypothetical protein